MGALFVERTGYPTFGIPESYSTTFPATEDPMSEGGKWYQGGVDTALFGNVKTTTNKALADRTITVGVNDYTDSIALLKPTVAFVPRSFRVSVTISNAGTWSSGSQEIEILGCGNSSFVMLEIILQAGGTGVQFVHQNGSKPGYTVLDGSGGTPTPGGSNWGTTFGNNEVVYADFTRSSTDLTIQMNKAGVAGPNIVIPFTSAYYPPGNLAGLGFYVASTNTPSAFCASAWSVGPIP